MAPAYCPHCLLPVADDVDGAFPPVPMGCPHCRLTIAVGRARTDVVGTAGASGSAAGLLASAARRAGPGEGGPVDDAVIDEALRFAAAQMGTPVQRLRMIDYQSVAAERAPMPDLASILDARGSWKRARRMVGAPLDEAPTG